MNNMDVKQTAPKTVQAMVHAALVSEDSQSMRSSLSEAAATNVEVKPQGITVDAALAKRAIEQRNHEERMRVAKAMLYHAYLNAVQGNGV